MSEKELGWFIALAGLILMGVCGFLGITETYFPDILSEASTYLVIIMIFVSLFLICFGVGKMKD
ncbi:MAG: hypothetical protein V3T94_03255 [Thermoplasmata archaeon]